MEHVGNRRVQIIDCSAFIATHPGAAECKEIGCRDRFRTPYSSHERFWVKAVRDAAAPVALVQQDSLPDACRTILANRRTITWGESQQSLFPTFLVVVRPIRKSQEWEILPLLWQDVAVVTFIRHQWRVWKLNLTVKRNNISWSGVFRLLFD